MNERMAGTETTPARSATPFVRTVAACRNWVRCLGPGVITGAADDDPSGISTYAIAGASTGLSMLWVALITTPMMAVIQGMCARIGMVSGTGLAAAIRGRFPAPLTYAIALLVIAANTLNIGADLAGMAASMRLLVGLPEAVWVVLFGAALIAIQLYLSYAMFVRVIKYLCLSLFAYIVTAFVVHPNWMLVLRHTFIPEVHFDQRWFTTLTAVLGTTITPYLFFWQSALMVEEERAVGRTSVAQRRGASPDEVKAAHADVNTGMIFSNVVMFFIILTTAVTLGEHGKTNITSAQDAAEALRPLAGNFAYVLFTAGMVATGLLAVPALAGSSAYVAAETFRFRGSLDDKPNRAPRFYSVIGAGISLGVLMSLMHLNAMAVLFWSAVINGLVAVPLVAVVILLANDKKLMGKWRSSRVANAWAGVTLVGMTATAASMFIFWGK